MTSTTTMNRVISSQNCANCNSHVKDKKSMVYELTYLFLNNNQREAIKVHVALSSIYKLSYLKGYDSRRNEEEIGLCVECSVVLKQLTSLYHKFNKLRTSSSYLAREIVDLESRINLVQYSLEDKNQEDVVIKTEENSDDEKLVETCPIRIRNVQQINSQESVRVENVMDVENDADFISQNSPEDIGRSDEDITPVVDTEDEFVIPDERRPSPVITVTSVRSTTIPVKKPKSLQPVCLRTYARKKSSTIKPSAKQVTRQSVYFSGKELPSTKFRSQDVTWRRFYTREYAQPKQKESEEKGYESEEEPTIPTTYSVFRTNIQRTIRKKPSTVSENPVLLAFNNDHCYKKFSNKSLIYTPSSTATNKSSPVPTNIPSQKNFTKTLPPPPPKINVDPSPVEPSPQMNTDSSSASPPQVIVDLPRTNPPPPPKPRQNLTLVGPTRFCFLEDDDDVLLNSIQEFQYPCPYTDCIFKGANSIDIEDHLELEHNHTPELMSCPICDEKYSDKSLLQIHVLVHQQKEKCPKCLKSFFTSVELESHLRTHQRHVNKNFKCPLPNCAKLFRSEWDLLRHHSRHTGQPVNLYSCEYCPEKFREWIHLKKHREIHVEHTFTCPHTPLCPQKFVTEEELNRHLKKCQPQLCNICGKTYKSPGQLREHMVTHTREKRHVCNYPGCGQKFLRSCYLRLHKMRQHTGERRHKCTEDGCDAAFFTKECLDTHKSNHNPPNREWLCAECGMAFRLMKQLNRHSRVHRDEFPYSCSYCEKKFKYSATKRTHELIHKNIWRYTCDTCGKKCRARHSYRRHLQTHTGLKPYKCKICGDSFPDNRPLKKHLLTHENSASS